MRWATRSSTWSRRGRSNAARHPELNLRGHRSAPPHLHAGDDSMTSTRLRRWRVHWIFRIAVCAEFVGHGAFGIITKAAWVPYFAVVGIPEWMAWRLMPVIGTVDIVLGLLA